MTLRALLALSALAALPACGDHEVATVGTQMIAAKALADEPAAIDALHALATCQARILSAGSIDVDGDGAGEFGTVQEMTGACGVRQSPDGSKRGAPLSPPSLPAAWATIDAAGVVTKGGYAFILYLPDDSAGGGWVHETGNGESASVTGSIGTDAAEARWCAYAWPVQRGSTGSRCFFVNETGTVLQSANDVARHSGASSPPPPGSASAAGGDGDTWTPVN